MGLREVSDSSPNLDKKRKKITHQKRNLEKLVRLLKKMKKKTEIKPVLHRENFSLLWNSIPFYFLISNCSS